MSPPAMPPDPRPATRLLASVSSRAPVGSACNRWHEIDLHDLQPGFRLTIRFRSSWCHQGDRETVRQLLETTPADLRRSLALVNPCADFEPHSYPTRRDRIESAIRTAWQLAIRQLLRDSAIWLDG